MPVLVPPERVKRTVESPVVFRFPFASFAVSVRVTIDPDATVPEEIEIRDWDAEIGPAVTVTVGNVLVTALPPMLALMLVAVPEVVPVKVAVYIPLPLSVVAEIVPLLRPPDRANTTVEPPEMRRFPFKSFVVRVKVTVEPEVTVAEETVMSD
jgi:hypothetical protein